MTNGALKTPAFLPGALAPRATPVPHSGTPRSLAAEGFEADYHAMLDWFARHLGVSPAVAGMLLVLIVLQLSAQLYALSDLARRPAVRGGRKWVWALIIAFGNLPGAIAYLVAGRTEPEETVGDAGSGASTAGSDAARRAVDALYGPRDKR